MKQSWLYFTSMTTITISQQKWHYWPLCKVAWFMQSLALITEPFMRLSQWQNFLLCIFTIISLSDKCLWLIGIDNLKYLSHSLRKSVKLTLILRNTQNYAKKWVKKSLLVMGKMVFCQDVTLFSHIQPKMSKNVEIFQIRQFWLNSRELFKVVLKEKKGNFWYFWLFWESILTNLALLSKFYIMKKNNLFCKKYQFHHM